MTLTDQLERLAAFEPAPYPVVSLSLNTQSNQVGRDEFQSFVRKELKARAQTYPQRSSDREMLERDLERITRYLENDLQPSANGIAIFACDTGELFEAVQLDAPIDEHWLYLGDPPPLSWTTCPTSRTSRTSPRSRGWSPSTRATRGSSPTPSARASSSSRTAA